MALPSLYENDNIFYIMNISRPSALCEVSSTYTTTIFYLFISIPGNILNLLFFYYFDNNYYARSVKSVTQHAISIFFKKKGNILPYSTF